jgi:malonate transporter MadL subunit
MAAQQNVVSALKGGPVALIAALGAVSCCACVIALINRAGPKEQDSSWQIGTVSDPT